MKVEPRGFPHELDVGCEHMHRYTSEHTGVKLRMDYKFLSETVKKIELQPTEMEETMGRTGLGRKEL